LGVGDQYLFGHRLAGRVCLERLVNVHLPKPTIRVSYAMVQIVEQGSDHIPSVLRLSATNMGPGEVTLSNALTKFQEHFHQSPRRDILQTLPYIREECEKSGID